MSKFWQLTIAGIVTLFIGLIGLIVLRCGWYTYVENYELAYSFDQRTGEINVIDQQGYVYSDFWVKVYSIDARPMQVTINANNRVLNAKLVKFNPAGLQTFVEWHGAHDYDGDTLGDILKSYAYDGMNKPYPFLTILRELNNKEGSTLAPATPEQVR